MRSDQLRTRNQSHQTYSDVPERIGEELSFEIKWAGGSTQAVRPYIKVYTEPQGQPWVADPVIKYVRNYQITDAPRFH